MLYMRSLWGLSFMMWCFGMAEEIMWEADGFSSYGYSLGSHILWPCKTHIDICSPLMTSGTCENKHESSLQLSTVFLHQSLPFLGSPSPSICIGLEKMSGYQEEEGGAIKAGKIESNSKNAFQKRTWHVSEANDTKWWYTGNLYKTQAIKEVDLSLCMYICLYKPKHMDSGTKKCGFPSILVYSTA